MAHIRITVGAVTQPFRLVEERLMARKAAITLASQLRELAKKEIARRIAEREPNVLLPGQAQQGPIPATMGFDAADDNGFLLADLDLLEFDDDE